MYEDIDCAAYNPAYGCGNKAAYTSSTLCVKVRRIDDKCYKKQFSLLTSYYHKIRLQ